MLLDYETVKKHAYIPMTAFFQRIAYKAGRIKAITATARKLAVVVYKMLTTGEAYEPTKLVRDIAQVKPVQIRQMKKKLAKFGITGAELGLFNNLKVS